jgi:hypothetical protein
VSSNGGMRFRAGAVVRMAGLGAGAWLLMAAGAARAQGSCTFTDEQGKTVTWPNCQPPTDGKTPPAAGGTQGQTTGTAPGASPAKSFPYPGDKPAPPSTPAGSTPAASAPGAPAAAGSNVPAGNRFPFPGEDSSGDAAKGGAKPAPPNGDGLQDAGSSGSSDGSSSSSSSSDEGGGVGPLAGDEDPAAKAADARRAERKRLANAPRQSPDEREVEDLKVAAFYQNDGNFKGAYDRAVDAVSLAGDDAEAHLALAEAARRLGKLDEAEKNYKKCLTLDPVPKTKKAAEKALKEMSGG